MLEPMDERDEVCRGARQILAISNRSLEAAFVKDECVACVDVDSSIEANCWGFVECASIRKEGFSLLSFRNKWNLIAA